MFALQEKAEELLLERVRKYVLEVNPLIPSSQGLRFVVGFYFLHPVALQAVEADFNKQVAIVVETYSVALEAF